MSEYFEKLKSPRWQRKRLEILERDGFVCKICGKTDSELHVHHKRYTKGADPWDEDSANLVSVCTHCHKKVTDVINRLRSEVMVSLEGIETCQNLGILCSNISSQDCDNLAYLLWYFARNARALPILTDMIDTVRTGENVLRDVLRQDAV